MRPTRSLASKFGAATLRLRCASPLLWALALSHAFPATETLVVLAGDPIHLGTAGQPEYDLFRDSTPAARSGHFEFVARPNSTEATLMLQQDDVKETWTVRLNGRELGKLVPMEAPLVHALAVPAQMLMEGSNTLAIEAPKQNDDVLIGPVSIVLAPRDRVLRECALHVRVTDEDSGDSMPARLTLLDERGALAALEVPADPPTATGRPGVVYTGSGEARILLRAGRYTVHATRGFEYGLDTRQIELAAGQTQALSLSLRREVATPDWVACDPHTHTFTFSRHGDATIEERVLTLAGEGIELPIATDHNILTDYSHTASTLGVHPWFTPVVGVEVTTRQAHFNVFPVTLGSRVPDFRIGDWPKLLENIRQTPGVQVVILNHPHNIHTGFQPFARTNFNPVTAQALQYLDFGFDALELINSSAQQSDMMRVVDDWFALLNAGHRITAVGSSDGHDVSRYIIGQGRTYLACPDQNPNRVDVTAACDALKAGRAIVSMGLFAMLTVEDRFGPGELAVGLSETVKVHMEVRGPGWVQAERVVLFGNGRPLREYEIDLRTTNRPIERDKSGHLWSAEWTMPLPAHDLFLVLMATGPDVDGLYWNIPRPYQPSSASWTARVASVTNPVWVDADGDGRFTDARTYARRLTEPPPSSLPALAAALAEHDESVAAHAAALWHQLGRNAEELLRLEELEGAAPQTRRGVSAYRRSLARP